MPRPLSEPRSLELASVDVDLSSTPADQSSLEGSTDHPLEIFPPRPLPLSSRSSNSSANLAGPSSATNVILTPILDSGRASDNSLDRSTIYEMFPALSKQSIDLIHGLLSMNSEKTVDLLLDVSAHKILCLLQQKKLDGPTMKLKVDEDDLLNDALLFYKAATFDPSRPLRVSFSNQPGIDTGGIKRQFFTDVLDKIAFKDPYSMFTGNKYRLCPAYSPQLLPLFKILGTLIVHSLIQEGPGFPYLAPYVYWYLVTGSEELALSYVTNEDLSADVSAIVEMV